MSPSEASAFLGATDPTRKILVCGRGFPPVTTEWNRCRVECNDLHVEAPTSEGQTSGEPLRISLTDVVSLKSLK